VTRKEEAVDPYLGGDSPCWFLALTRKMTLVPGITSVSVKVSPWTWAVTQWLTPPVLKCSTWYPLSGLAPTLCGFPQRTVMLPFPASTSSGLLGEAGKARRSGGGGKSLALSWPSTVRWAEAEVCPVEVRTWQVYSPVS
jgi:hypothetical protein